MSAHWATTGRRCVCIGEPADGWVKVSFRGYCAPHRLPMVGEILTVLSATAGGNPAAMVPGSADKVYLTFFEIPESQNDGPITVGTVAWDAAFFRPLVEPFTDIAVFETILDAVESEVVA